jgi:hypothetical protein
MFPSVNRSPRRRNRAVTLIEAVLYIAIALALIVGGLVFFQQASTAAKTNTMVRQLSAVLAEARVLVKGMPVSSDPININYILVSAGAVPSDIVNDPATWPHSLVPQLSNPFGGTTELRYQNLAGVYGQVIRVILTNIPQGVCARLLTASSGTDSLTASSGVTIAGEGTNLGGTTLISSGYLMGGAGNVGLPPHKGYMMNPTQAGWMCKYGSTAYTNKTVEPTSTPLSGNVEVRMTFLVER